MTADPGPLFIVDNSAGGRSGLQYVREWSEIADRIDIATGFFEIGSLLDLDGHWQRFEKVRILMGDEVAHRTKKLLLEAVKQRATSVLDRSIDADKADNPFLTGADAIVQGLLSGQIQCRVYNRDKFHAKAYITHGRLDVIGSQALVGSSNFTRPGLTQNVELNIKLESSTEVAQLQRWYEKHWNDAQDITADILHVIQRHTQEFSPFDVYARSLQALVSRHEITDGGWDKTRSRVFEKLDRYQQEGYHALIDIARRHGGALLCDGVGLGKTFVGLMLIERLILHENKRVVLFAPKSVKESVWTPELRRYLPHIGGIAGGADYSSLSIFSHTDLTRGGEFPTRFERVTELADVVIIDEAHHFRNRGRKGDPEDPSQRSRYRRLYDLIGGSERAKSVFMLTATPINNSLNDFRHLLELFTRDDDSYFARTLGVTSVAARLNSITRELAGELGDATPISENLELAHDLLSEDVLFKGLVVQRSRSYARESQILETGDAAVFPKREDPRVAQYSIRKSYAKLLDLIDEAFERQSPLFSLAIYYPLAYYCGDDEEIDPIEENRQKQVVALIRTNFLKRFESSVYAFELSCDRLLRKLLAFLEKNVETDPERTNLERWQRRHAELLTYAHGRQLEFWGEPEDESADEDIVPAELLERTVKLSRDEYDVPEIIQETYNDLDQIAALLDESRKFQAKDDDKLRALVRLLNSREIADRKVLIFTEFADTARYLRNHLREAGVDGVAQIDSGTKTDRAEVIRRFAPYYNGTTSTELADAGEADIRVLISTDVLSEGLNLQDATRLVNYDIHWNPVRLMQRIGRVDRRLNPDVEIAIKTDHPKAAKDRGRVFFWNFLPPEELDDLLKLYGRVSHKTLLISKTLGIEGRKLLTPDDDFDALKEFNAAYEGTTTASELLHLELQKLLESQPGLADRLEGLPRGIFSGKRAPDDRAEATFFCYELPALDATTGEFTLEAGTTRWYLHLAASGEVLEEPAEIAEWIRSSPATARECVRDQADLRSARTAVRKHIKNSYLKHLDVPLSAPPEVLIGWLEVNRD